MSWNLRRRSWVSLDFSLSAGAICAAYLLQPQFEFGWASSNPAQPAAIPAALIYPWFVILIGHIAGLHDPLGDRRRWHAVLRIVVVVLGAIGMFLVLLYFSLLAQLGRSILFRTFVLNISLLVAARLLMWNLASMTPRKIGCYLSAPRLDLLGQLVKKHHVPLILLSAPVRKGEVDSEEEIASHFNREKVDEVIVSSLELGEFHSHVWLACLNRGLQVTDISVFSEREYYQVPCDEVGVAWILSIDLKWNNFFYHRLKRLVDIVGATFGLILSSPLLALGMIGIVLESGRPVIYSQLRVGFRGKVYRIWKLRTMTTDAELNGARWATKNDARITRMGRVLRRSRIDELPQFWNVLCGNMSLIGPRPERPEFVSELAKEIPLYSQRHWVKPGITGWAQINYPYGASVEDARQKLCYDLYYLKNASLLLDMHITLRTIGALMKGSR